MQFLRFLIVFFCFHQAYTQISFFKTYSNGGFDRGEGVVQLPDSGYLVTGSSSSYNTNSKQAFIMRLDSLGNFKWSRDYGGNESDKGRRIFYVENDGIYVLGQSNSFGNSFFDAYFFKTDVNGNLLFENRYGGSNYEDVFDAVMLKDTSFIAVGVTNSTVNEVENVYIFRVNKFGERLWTKSIGSNYYDAAKSIKIYDDTTVYIVGEMYDELQLKQRGMLMKMHINGTVHWTKLYGSESKHGFNDLDITRDTIRIVGFVYNDLMNDRSNLYMSSHTVDGTLIYTNIEYNTGEYTIDHIQNYENNFMLLKSIKNEPSIPTYEDGLDASLYLYNGDLYYQGLDIKLSYTGNDIVNQIIKTNDGGIITVGFNEYPIVGGNNVYLAKIGKNNQFVGTNLNYESIVHVSENKKTEFRIFPNPVKDIVQIKSELPIQSALLFNHLGKEVIKTKHTTIDVSELNDGIYFLKLDYPNQSYIEKILIQR